MNVQPSNPNNPIVFFDVTIGGQVRAETSHLMELMLIHKLTTLKHDDDDELNAREMRHLMSVI